MRARSPLCRFTAAVAIAGVGLAATPLLGVAAATDPLPPLADPTADGAFCDGASNENPFTDLGRESSSTREVILCLVDTGLTKGTSATTYSPGAPVTRRQMSMFVKRLADLLNRLEEDSLTDLPAYDGVPDYPDIVLEDLDFQEAIGQLTQAEIVGGFPDGTFRPGALVSRRQMAAFVNRLQDFLTGAPFATANDYFDDDEGDPGEANLNALASVGIFQGDGNARVTPGGNLSRRQMANILLRYAQVLFADGSVGTPFAQEEQPPDQTPPTSIFATMSTAAGVQDVFDSGDVLTIVFNEPLPAPAPAAAVRLYDQLPGASSADIVNGVSAVFTLNAAPVVVDGQSRAAGSVLTITLTSAPAPVTPVDAVLEVPATIQSASGIADYWGNGWSVMTSPDVTIER